MHFFLAANLKGGNLFIFYFNLCTGLILSALDGPGLDQSASILSARTLPAVYWPVPPSMEIDFGVIYLSPQPVMCAYGMEKR